MSGVIDYKKIADAISFYESRGFSYIEVPWCVSREVSNITKPKGKINIKSFFGYHVASGEQSFLQMISKNNLDEGYYICSTPCYRNEEIINELHKKWFMKVELIYYFGKRKTSFHERKEKFDFILNSSCEFYSRYLEIDKLKTKEGVDIISSKEKIELGSYGVRGYKNFSWVYGTGVAEPRLSYVLSLRGRGYHIDDIPKSKFGSFEKIKEELMELIDSNKQGIKLMELLELSDLIGAIEGYVDKEYFGKITINDLIKMNEVTKRAFISGRRK